MPAPNTGFAAVAGAGYHSLGVKADGTIVAWGDNSYGQCDVPAPNTGFVAIAAGFLHSLGLKSDGSIVGWGHNGSGQLNVPAPNTDFVAVSGGGYHSLGLKFILTLTGACCIGNGCVTTNEAECAAAGATYQGDDTTCAEAVCPETCLGDLDGDGDVDLADYAIFAVDFGCSDEP